MRRLVFLAATMFWLGGFTFYTAVVVPVGTQVLGSATEQGFITQRVTNFLNIAGGVCLAVWAIELGLQNRRHSGRSLRWSLWFGHAVGLLALFLLHPRLDRLLVDAGYIADVEHFRFLHRIYLWISTVQWFAAIALLYATVRNWGMDP